MNNKKSTKIEKNIELLESFSGKIEVEEGVKFLKQLKVEAKRQEAVKKADFTNAMKDIDDIPLVTTDPELDRLADSLELYDEEDDF